MNAVSVPVEPGLRTRFRVEHAPLKQDCYPPHRCCAATPTEAPQSVEAVELRIKGYDVTTDGEGCGTNQMLVYYAYFYEDDARDDVEGPFPMIIDVE